MEHRGVRYTVRAGIERDSWSVAIYPDGVESVAFDLKGIPRSVPIWTPLRAKLVESRVPLH
jgi:hypothetical protein